MKLALVRDGIVENIIIPPEGEWEAPEGCTTVALDDDAPVGPGFTYDGETFAEPVIVTPAPASVTPLQIRKALRQVGLKEAVDAMLANVPEEVAEEWEYATAIDRDNPTLQAAAQGLQMSEEQVDDLFRLAASLI